VGLWLAAPPPYVELRAADVVLTDAARLRVELQSSDRRSHRLRLEASAESGLRLQPGNEIELPASGSVVVERLLFRGTAQWGSRHELRLVALEATDLAQAEPRVAGFATVIAQVRPDPAWLPRLRWPLALVGSALLLAALLRELRRP
jgi:hypothetical protein